MKVIDIEKILIAGPASQILGIKIAKKMEIECIDTEFKKFPDGENYLRLNLEDETIIEGKEVIIIQSLAPSADYDQNARIFQLFMMIDAVKRIGAERIVLIIPYLAYARQDKIFRPGESQFANALLSMINTFNIDEFYVVDVHAPSVLEEMSCKTINIDSMRLLANYIKSLDPENIVVISPDKGAIERSKAFAKYFGESVPVEIFEKRRDVKTGDITMKGQLELKDRDVVIADDIIATGGTMAKAIKLAKKSGARKIYAAATHALLLQNAKFRILSAGADEIIGTDSIDNEVSKVSLANAIIEYLK
ncbi:MAG: ribose-phosphate diphosphokinase [Promethearchaeota archaeon]|nr:MAG: ribose-phosphate diphosphokinase [Candidatus Lokiarchaeota archaeon]